MKDSDNIARLNEFRDDIAAKFNVEVWSRYSELGNGKRKGIICQYKRELIKKPFEEISVLCTICLFRIISENAVVFLWAVTHTIGQFRWK